VPQELFDHAALSALFRYWEKKRGARKMPARHDIDPIEMDRRLLPHLMLCEVSANGNIVRFRLVGTSLAKRLGFDPTGQRLSDLPRADYFDFLGSLVRRVYLEGVALYGESAFYWASRGRLDARHLLLPLSAGGSEAAIVLIGTAYSSDEVFPPQICALNGIAQHCIGKREVVTSSPPEKQRSANIA
jgi:hypothetical protein